MRFLIFFLHFVWLVHSQHNCYIFSQSVSDYGNFNLCSSITFYNVSQFNVTDIIEIDNQNGFSMSGDTFITTIQCSGSSGFIFNNTHNILLENMPW